MTALLVANDGGHLMQLHTLAPRLPLGQDRVWVTPRTPQSESLLRGERVLWVHPAPSRDVAAVLRNVRAGTRVFSAYDVRVAVSTGSSLAASLLPQARLRGVECHYVESATRLDGPSLTGRFLQSVPGIRLHCQYPEWQSRRWTYAGSVFDGYEEGDRHAVGTPWRVVVSLGTSERYSFRRLVERLLAVLPRDCEVLWQTGSTDVDGLPIDARRSLPAAELATALQRADLVVAHAGTGIALSALEAGKLPLLVPRRAELGEHVDDHQEQIAAALERRKLAVVRHVDELTAHDLHETAGRSVHRAADPPPFRW